MANNMKTGEAELLLPRGTRLRVTNAEFRPGAGTWVNVPGGGVLYLDAEIVP
jgi:hypothetical protein